MAKNKLEELAKFLYEAKRATFASRFSIPRLNPDRSKEYRYSKKNFLYKDKYYGDIIDTGQELVFYKGGLIWSMSYRGGMLEGYQDSSRACFSFLKRCLREIPKDFPVRGPKLYQRGDFKYQNQWQGSLEDFTGEEKIFWKGVQIYFRNYIGGTGKPRLGV